MAYSITYDRLLGIAAGAVGLDRSHLTADERTSLNEVPNQAVADLAQERAWNYLQRSIVLTTIAGLYTYLLPADFAQFWRPGAFTYGKASGYPKLNWTDLVSIRNMRAAGDTTGTPTHVTLGEAVAELDSVAAVIGGSGALSGVHKYRYRRIDAAGVVHWSDIASVTHAGATVNATVSGWPSEAGTVTLYRTKLNGSVLYAVPGGATINSASAASYVDSTLDAALGTTTFPASSLATDTILGRQQIEFYPAPFGVYSFTGSYRRTPGLMTVSSSVPDIPVALTSALESLVKMTALAKFNRGVPDALRAEYSDRMTRGDRLLADQNPGNGEPLCDVVVRRGPALAVGRQIDLKSGWGT